MSMRDLPFSQQQSNSAKGGNFIRGLFIMMIMGILAVMHYFVYSYFVVILILCILSIIASWLMMDALNNKTWDSLVTKVYEG